MSLLLCRLRLNAAHSDLPTSAPAGHAAAAVASSRNSDRRRADAAEATQRNGGSLLHATLVAAGRRRPGAARDVSFFAVPEPEPRVIKKHDLVTIIVREESEFSSEGTTDSRRRPSSTRAIEEFIKLDALSGLRSSRAAASRTPCRRSRRRGNREFKGEGTVDRTDSFTAAHHRRGARREAQRHARPPGPQAHQDRRGGAEVHPHRHLPRRGHHAPTTRSSARSCTTWS